MREATEAKVAKTTSSVHNIGEDKPPFGSRFLTDEAQVWSHNAWDHVPPPDDQAEKIAQSLNRQRAAPVPAEERSKYNDKPARHWDNFYKANAGNFFRNRKWLSNEFLELIEATKPGAGPTTIVEIGCGAGNAVFPLLSVNQNPLLSIRAYDYSSHAVKVVQNHPLYTSPPMGDIHSAVWDFTSAAGLPDGLIPGSVDIVTMVFVLSALHPDEWNRALLNVYTMLKPGGLVFFRDYGRHDLTQLRFKTGRMLGENLYIRGDKTRVYFFELDELALLFTGRRSEGVTQNTETTEYVDDVGTVGDGAEVAALPAPEVRYRSAPVLVSPTDTPSATPSEPETTQPPAPSVAAPTIHPNLLSPFPNLPPHPLFSIEQLGVDRRLLVNRKRMLKMYRVWMQGKFRKLDASSTVPEGA
ncbi:methyltransferase [Pleurotus eryngii]|uniref:tRNA N(3)-methylcytidine methyltransferase n=1 Tax=Pleurotus eryngii TaxID=5323 RepID=A0A9P5ZZ31_PLEER|nr:methyltransferase [Pleurotus eryngii]